ncbi:hypothetical protein KAW64_15525 [bacterium]|nr:hypothetical protein [bacterium]
MLFQRTLIVALLAALALAAAATCTAQVPQRMNYQVMLTNDADQPLADQSVQLVFRIYNVEAGGGSLWTETHNVTTNSIGVVSVVLGTYNPMTISFEGPLWLQVAVDGEIMSPRRELTSAPYALSVSAGAAGDGHSLDADDGDPVDVVYVHGNGIVTVGNPVAVYGYPKLQVFSTPDETAGYFKASTGNIFDVGVFARSDSSSGITGNAKTPADYYATTPAAVVGVAAMNAGAGAFFANGDGDGVYAATYGAGDALYSIAAGTGRAGYFSGGIGVEMELPDTNTFPVLQITNNEASWYGDCLHLSSQPNVDGFSYTLHSDCYSGSAGYFDKDTNDGRYNVIISSPVYDSPGLYVYGYIYSSSMIAREVETSRGKEAVFSVSSPQVEMVASGQGQLSAGAARVDFDRIFAESITGPDDLRITATPIGGWSALYVERIDADGFDLRSESGRTDVEFHWAAVGRAEGHERAPEITIPDHEEEERILKLKKAEMKSRRPKGDRREHPSVVAAENQ